MDMTNRTEGEQLDCEVQLSQFLSFYFLASQVCNSKASIYKNHRMYTRKHSTEVIEVIDINL